MGWFGPKGTCGCCTNYDPTTCSTCKSPETITISGSVDSTGPGQCGGTDVVDGTYAITFTQTAGGGYCYWTTRTYYENCTSPTRTYAIDISVSIHTKGLVTIPLTSVVSFPYSTGVRIIVSVLYSVNGTTVKDEHQYLADFETCPEGSQSISFLRTLLTDLSSGTLLINSTAPTSVSLTFPTP